MLASSWDPPSRSPSPPKLKKAREAPEERPRPQAIYGWLMCFNKTMQKCAQLVLIFTLFIGNTWLFIKCPFLTFVPLASVASLNEVAQVFHDLGEDLGDLEKQALSKLGGLFSWAMRKKKTSPTVWFLCDFGIQHLVDCVPWWNFRELFIA